MAGRRYDKGEKRHEHEWNGSEPKIEFEGRNPRRWIGKCPSNIPAQLRSALLNEAIPAPPGDRELAYAKALYVVHEGAIYEAQTSDRGTSYHGYPYRGKLSRRLFEMLRAMARAKACLAAFEKWAREHIEIHG